MCWAIDSGPMETVGLCELRQSANAIIREVEHHETIATVSGRDGDQIVDVRRHVVLLSERRGHEALDGQQRVRESVVAAGVGEQDRRLDARIRGRIRADLQMGVDLRQVILHRFR